MESRSGTPRKRKKRQKCTVSAWCRRNRFLLLLVSSTVGGYFVGLSLQSWTFSAHVLHLIGFPGQLVLRAFLMIIVPLLFCSLVLGVASLRKGGDARMVVLTIGFFLLLSTLSAIMGAAAGHLVHPGQKITTSQVTSANQGWSGRKGFILDSMLDLLWNAIPSNIIESTFTKEYTHVEILNTSLDDTTNASVIYKKTVRQTRGVNFMGLLTFSILFGSALAISGDKGHQLHQVIEQINEVVMIILGYILNVLPVGMFFWMFREGLEAHASTVDLLGYLGLFLATGLGCIALHQFIILPLLYIALVRKNPIRYHLNLLPAMLTAFGTSSSAATLPVTLRCAEESNRLNCCVTRFVLPLGMVVHMNGGTFYLPLSAIFLAQLEGIQVGMAQTIIMCITSLILCISAPATPNAGNPVYLLTVLAAGGINRPQFISLVLSMEWLMERFRTVMNVVADSYVAAIVEKLCSNRLPKDNVTDSSEYPTPVIRGYDLQAIRAQPPVTLEEATPVLRTIPEEV